MRLPVVTLLALLGLGLFACDDGEPDPGESAFPSLEQYLEQNNITEFEKTDSGLIYVINQEGTGNLPQTGNTVSVHYTGYHLDDTKFDSSYDRNEAFPVLLGAGRVIAGWEEGIRFFKKGGAGTLYIPYELAYGASGTSDGTIGPKEDLKFDINIIAID